MGLEDRIEEEMMVDTESRLEEHFEEANQLFRIFQNGSIDIEEDFEDASWRERVLIHLIGHRYAFEGNKVESPGLPYEYFYDRFDVGDSTIREYMNELADDLIVEKDGETDEWRLLPDNLSEVLDRTEGL